MKFHTDKEILKKVTELAKFTGSGKHVEGTDNADCLKIVVKDGKVDFTACHGINHFYKSSMDASSCEDGEILINAQAFGRMLKSIPDGDVLVDSKRKFITVQDKCSKLQYGALAGEFFPLPTPKYKESIQLTFLQLQTLVEQTQHSVSVEDTTRVAQTGFHIQAVGHDLFFESCDGYSGTRCTIKNVVPQDKTKIDAIVLSSILMKLVTSKAYKEDDIVTIRFADRYTGFIIENDEIISLNIGDQFMDTKDVFAPSVQSNLNCNLKQMQKAIDDAMFVLQTGPTRNIPMRLVLDAKNKVIKYSCVSGISKISGNIDYTADVSPDDKTTWGLNPVYLGAIVSLFKDEISFGFNNPLSPMSFHLQLSDNMYSDFILCLVRVKE